MYLTYNCSYCELEFNTEADCLEHEKTCLEEQEKEALEWKKHLNWLEDHRKEIEALDSECSSLEECLKTPTEMLVAKLELMGIDLIRSQKASPIKKMKRSS